MSNAVAIPFAVTREVHDQCLCLSSQRAARALARRFDAAFRPLGLTNGQFSLLMSLNRPKAPTMARTARLMAMDRTTLTAALKPLERNGLLTVDVDPGDRRGRLLVLTAAGYDKLAAALPIWRATQATVESSLPPQGADGLRDFHRRLSLDGSPDVTSSAADVSAAGSTA